MSKAVRLCFAQRCADRVFPILVHKLIRGAVSCLGELSAIPLSFRAVEARPPLGRRLLGSARPRCARPRRAGIGASLAAAISACWLACNTCVIATPVLSVT